MSSIPENPYPLTLEGELDPQLSRWLWLVKWLLVIPHVVAARVPVDRVPACSRWSAFFAILATGRYPRAIFDFNLGVMRWTLAGRFYSYSALGTDRYPPFTLGGGARLPGPARRRLSAAALARARAGEVVVAGAAALPDRRRLRGRQPGPAGTRPATSGAWSYGGGLIGLLVFFAGVMLLFTGRYPRGDLRLRDGHEPLVLPGRRVRRADDRRVPAVPARHGRPRADAGRRRRRRRWARRPRPACPDAETPIRTRSRDEVSSQQQILL